MSRFVSALACVVALSPLVAGAQDEGGSPDISASAPTVSRGGQGWSLHSGQTVGAGSNVVGAQLGWPGLSVAFLHGATEQFDIGAKFTPLNYGFEGRVRDVTLGMKLQAVARLQLVDTGKLNVGVEFAPGPLFYFRRHYTQVGLAIPVKITAGLPVVSAILVNFGMDAPMFVTFGFNGGFYIPLLFGGGVEYFIDRRLSVSFNLKMGPSIYTPTGTADFAMDALIGVGYKL